MEGRNDYMEPVLARCPSVEYAIIGSITRKIVSRWIVTWLNAM